MKNKKHLAFLGAIILFIVVLATGVYIQEDLRRNGQQVILATVPVDPRDVLRGDYVDLAYEIGRSEKATTFAKNMTESAPIYALLTLGEDNRVVDYTFSITEPKEGVYIRGEGVVEEYEFYQDEGKNKNPILVKEKRGSIRYPQIEQYFVPEGKGWAIGRMGQTGSGKKLEAKIVLDDNGRAQILELLVDGKTIDLSTIEAENPYSDEPKEFPETASVPAEPKE